MGYVVDNDVVPRGSGAHATHVGTDSSIAGTDSSIAGTTYSTQPAMTGTTGTTYGTQPAMTGTTGTTYGTQPAMSTTYGAQPIMTGSGATTYGTQTGLASGDRVDVVHATGEHTHHSSLSHTSTDYHNTDQKKGMKEKAVDKVEQLGDKLEQQRHRGGNTVNKAIDKAEQGLHMAHNKLTGGNHH